jgi:hypothetical protein
VHPHRTEEWLQERLRDGFDVHHIDGDHSNDDPINLVLIECVDHLRLHGKEMNRLEVLARRKKSRRDPQPKLPKNEAFQARALAAWARRKAEAQSH